MGREARLRAQGLSKRKNIFIVVVKNDFSYEVSKEENGQKVVEKVERISYVPLGLATKHVSSFKSEQEADDFIKDFLNNDITETQQQILLTKDFRILEVKYAPTEKRTLSSDWIKRYLINEVKVNMANKKSSKLL